jgi:carbon storage regulator
MAMLVLARRLGETIVIDRHTRVTVVAVKGDQVRLGITAPKEVLVDRHAVYERRFALRNASVEDDALKPAESFI